MHRKHLFFNTKTYVLHSAKISIHVEQVIVKAQYKCNLPILFAFVVNFTFFLCKYLKQNQSKTSEFNNSFLNKIIPNESYETCWSRISHNQIKGFRVA